MTGSRRTAHPLRRHAMRRAAILAAGGMLLALAACESTPADETAGSTTETTANAARAETTTGADDQGVETRLSTPSCKKPDNGRVYFHIGSATFAVPADDVRDVVPSGMPPAASPKQIVEKLKTETAAGAGCPETPLNAARLAVAGVTNDPMVKNVLLLFHARSSAQSYGDLTRKMLANPEKCQKAGEGLLACGVLVRGDGRQRRLLFVVSTNQNMKLAFGGPLAARCDIVGEKIDNCEIRDELSGEVGLLAPLKGPPADSATLARAHKKAIAAVKQLRL